MCEGVSVQIVRGDENLSINATGKFSRNYSTNELNIDAELIPRYERWYGSFGAYKPSGNSQTHLILEEGQQHFYSKKEALEWLAWKNKRLRYVYTSNGLVIGWEYQTTSKNKKVLSVELLQFYIKGKKPNQLEGSRDDLIRIANNAVCSEKITVGKFQPSPPQKINGRMFSGKAIDIMKERGVSLKQVEAAIKSTVTSKNGNYTFYYNLEPNKGTLFWVQLDQSGRVVLVG